MFAFILTSLISALAGGAAGYLVARYRWKDELDQLEENRQLYRRERLEWHREQFQDSTSRIHRPSQQQQDTSMVPLEDLEQLRLEMTILKEDLRLERELLEEENREMRLELDSRQQPDAVFVDLSDTGTPAEDAVHEEKPSDDETEDGTEAISEDTPEAISAEEDVDGETIETGHEPISAEGDEQPEADANVDPSDGNPAVPDTEEVEDVADVAETDAAEPVVLESDAPEPAATESTLESIPAPESHDRGLSVPGDIKAVFAADVTDESDKSDEGEQHKEEVNDDKAHETVLLSDDMKIDEEIPAPAFSFHWETRRPAAAVPSADRPVRESPRTAMPAFRSLYDMLNASGVAAAPSTPPDETEETVLVRDIVGLDGDSFQLLQELGYATLKKLSSLSTSETRRLAAVFRIHEQRIEQDWKPTARAHINLIQADASRSS